MVKLGGEIIVGILGQWASGKSTAAKTIIKYLGGEVEVIFLTDKELVAGQAVNYILEIEDSSLKVGIEDDERQRFESDLVTVWLGSGEDLDTVDLNTLLFDLHDDVYDDVTPEWCGRLDKARLELVYQIRERLADGKPIVVEAGSGKNPTDHTIPDLFARLEESGVEPQQVRWIIVEAGNDRRSERNKKRRFGSPADVFAKYAADGGDLDPDQLNMLAEQGTIIKRVPNDHDDIGRFRADIIAAIKCMFRDMLSTSESK